MAAENKIINLYIDRSGALYGAPFGKSKKYGMRPIDRLFLLMPGYTDEMLCEFVNRLFDCCGSEDAKDDMPTSIQTYLKAKSYKEAIQNLGLLVGFYAENEGFAFTPAENTGEGFVLGTDTVEARPDCTRKEMAKKLKAAIAAVHIGKAEGQTEG